MADKEELYKELERGKVLAIEIEADSRNELLARATTALSRLMVQPDNVKAADRREIEIVDDTDVEMMQDMLSAALNVFRSGFVWREAELEERGGPIVVWLSGERYDPDRHSLVTEIKGVQERQTKPLRNTFSAALSMSCIISTSVSSTISMLRRSAALTLSGWTMSRDSAVLARANSSLRLSASISIASTLPRSSSLYSSSLSAICVSSADLFRVPGSR